MDNKKQTGLLAIIAALIPAMLMLFVMSILLLASDDDDACTPVSSQLGADIDPEAVPDGPIAGFDHDQLVNAAWIIKAGHDLGLSTRDQTIGVMTAMTESQLTVLDHGDAVGPDSRGLFQQRGGGAWGSEEDRMDPYTSATNFFERLKDINGRESMEPTLVAHKVQANADPWVFNVYWERAVEVVEALGDIKGISNDEAPESTQYALGDVQPQTAIVANKIGPMFGIKTIGGYRDATSPYDDMTYGHPAGRAIDFMINDIEDGENVGHRLAKYLQENAEDLTVYYIIWQQRIWMAGDPIDDWEQMEDRGSPTQNHMDHVHLSLDVTGDVTVPDADTAACKTSNTTGDTTTAVNAEGWASPGAGPITSAYGMRWGTMHSGTDLAGGGCDGPIWAAQDGTVTMAGFDSGGNGTIIIDHGDGVETAYLHMYQSGILVNVGDKISAGQQIGRVGSSGDSTGCHLHFGVRLHGEYTDPVPFMAQVGINLGE